MDLPKNITQIGVQDANCKIYVEDYVVSFLKQLNPIARDKTMAAALYGRRKTEEDKTYLFVYGAGKLDFIQKETRHLSQAQRQEIERIRRQYFQDYEFLGYRILDGEMVDGFDVCEQEICRYVSGYAQFYENNEAMLTYMLESRQGDAAPESVDSVKYEMVRDRQEKRREKYVRHKREKEKEEASKDWFVGARKKGIQATAVTLLLLFLMLGLAMNTSLLEKGSEEWEWIKREFLEKKLPDDTLTDKNVTGVSGNVAVGGAMTGEGSKPEILKADDKLAEAVRAENEKDVLPVSGKVLEEGKSGNEKGVGQAQGQDSQNDTGNTTGSTAESAAGKENEGTTGSEAGKENGGAAGSEAGKETGSAAGSAIGKENGSTAGNEAGKENGGAAGSEAGKETGSAAGSAIGKDNGSTVGKEEASATGSENGSAAGKEAGNASGKDEAKESDSDREKDVVKEENVKEDGTNHGKSTAEEDAKNGRKDKPESYVVCKGDTLNGICFRIYGNINYVEKICQLNEIANPDEIQIGQKILLP